jgi:hypothetical protein
MRRLPTAVVFALTLLVQAVLAEDGPPSAIAGLPSLPKPKPVEAKPLPTLTAMAPGIQVAAAGGLVVFDGRVQIDQGPVDGLEVFACLNGGKTHETCITLDTAAAEAVKAACIAVLGVGDGQGSPQNIPAPTRGTPVRVVMRWEDPDQAGRWLEVDASCLVRDRLVDRPYPPLPFIYFGSRFIPIAAPGPDGKPVNREQFMLASTRSAVAVYDDPDALIGAPFPESWRDNHFEVYSAISPPVGTRVRLVISRATLPLTLELKADGALASAGTVLDDAALAGLLARHYGEGATPSLRAVVVNLDADMPREQDEAVRRRLLAAATTAKAWVVPVFALRK